MYKLKVEDRGAISSILDKSRGQPRIRRERPERPLARERSRPGSRCTRNRERRARFGDVEGDWEKPAGAHQPHHTPARVPHRHPQRDHRRLDGTHTWGFSFNLKSPDVRPEEGGGGHSRKIAGGRRPIRAYDVAAGMAHPESLRRYERGRRRRRDPVQQRPCVHEARQQRHS